MASEDVKSVNQNVRQSAFCLAVIGITGTIVGLIFLGLSLQAEYLRKLRIANLIAPGFGRSLLKYEGPSWIPKPIQKKLVFYRRLRHLGPFRLKDDGYRHLKELANLESLELGCVPISDKAFEHLQSLTHLKEIKDATQISAEGRKTLRKALPNCKITPYP